jgi:hypothetical protein
MLRVAGLVCAAAAALGLTAWGCASGTNLEGPAPGSGGGPDGGAGGSGGEGGIASGPGGGAPCMPGDPSCSCEPGESEACDYDGPAGTEGVGICSAGTHTCVADGEFPTWGPCTGVQLPLEELCDEGAVDEDCDGQVNEVCSECPEGTIEECGVVGACEYRMCVGGQWSGCGAAADIVLQDGFESATPGIGIPAPTAFAPWAVSSGDVDVMLDPNGLIGPAHTGSKAVDLNGWNPGGVATTLTTVPGATYLVSFAYTKNPSPEVPMPTGARVTVDGTDLLAVTASQMNSYDNLMWECAVTSFTATAASTTLEVASTTSVPANGGVYVDSFLVTAP